MNAMNPLAPLDAQDLEMLAGSEPGTVLGHLMAMNRSTRYHNTLDTLAIAQCISDLRRSSRSVGPDARSVEEGLVMGPHRSTFVPSLDQP
ncbi:MAG: hypothetical protein JNM31_00580 [Flavobacteriales bacterium]|nr:hypothetical protein [Flavobacteriales bacterium]